MQSEAPLPTPSEIWGVLPPRFAEELKSNAADIWRLSGYEDEYGPPSVGFTREREIHEMIDEITAIIMAGIALDMEARQSASRTGRGAGRPRDVLSRHLGPALLEMFLRCHDSAGRKSVLTSIDGKLAQEEAGPLFEFIKVAIEPVNHYLVADLHRRPLSPARLAREALDRRRRDLRRARRPRRRCKIKLPRLEFFAAFPASKEWIFI